MRLVLLLFLATVLSGCQTYRPTFDLGYSKVSGITARLSFSPK